MTCHPNSSSTWNFKVKLNSGSDTPTLLHLVSTEIYKKAIHSYVETTNYAVTMGSNSNINIPLQTLNMSMIITKYHIAFLAILLSTHAFSTITTTTTTTRRQSKSYSQKHSGRMRSSSSSSSSSSSLYGQTGT